MWGRRASVGPTSACRSSQHGPPLGRMHISGDCQWHEACMRQWSRKRAGPHMGEFASVPVWPWQGGCGLRPFPARCCRVSQVLSARIPPRKGCSADMGRPCWSYARSTRKSLSSAASTSSRLFSLNMYSTNSTFGFFRSPSATGEGGCRECNEPPDTERVVALPAGTAVQRYVLARGLLLWETDRRSIRRR